MSFQEVIDQMRDDLIRIKDGNELHPRAVAVSLLKQLRELERERKAVRKRPPSVK